MVEEFFARNHQLNRYGIDPFILPVNNQYELRPSRELPWFPVDLPGFPLEAALNEARALKPEFVEHRDEQGHRGWKSICLHGISAKQTGTPDDYGMDPADHTLYKWTEVAERCPETIRYLRETFPSAGFRRVRFMLVEAGGYIQPHVDREKRSLGPLHIVLNTPPGCGFAVEGHGLIPFKAGQGMLVDVSYLHSVWNRSQTDRYHIIVEIVPGNRYRDYIELIMGTYRRGAGFWRHFSREYRRYKAATVSVRSGAASGTAEK